MHFRLSKSPSDVDIGFGFQVALGGDVDLQVDLALGGVNLAEDLDLRCGS